MVVGVIAQARMGSSRLPGKVLMSLAGLPVVHHVLLRALAMRRPNIVCLATSDLPIDTPLAEAAKALNVHVFRGPEADVLARYLQAARDIEADVILRITCDCPLIDPAVCDALLAYRDRHKLEFASVNHTNGWPLGLDCEVFTRELLERCVASATTAYEREHVTPWMYSHARETAGAVAGPGEDAARHRWVLDYQEDYAYLSRLFEYLPKFPQIPGWREVDLIAKAHPEWGTLNAKWRQAHLPSQSAGELC